MNVFFDDITALEQWRYDDDYVSTLQHHVDNPNLMDTPATCHELRVEVPRDGVDPNTTIHLLTGSPANRPLVDGYYISCVKHPLPADSFRRVDVGIYRASPELCFVRLASRLSLEQLIQLGMELCGTYVLRPDTRRGFDNHDSQLTSVERLSAYIEELGQTKGLARARKALKYVRDGSASPMETCQYMLLCLPLRMGGYGLTGAEVNGELPLSPRAALLAERESFRCDLFWRDKGVAVEYDSKEDHLGLAAFVRDNAKRNVLMDMGIKVYIVSSNQIIDPEQFDVVAHMVARAIGKRLRDYPADWENRHTHLYNKIFASLKNRRTM